MTTKAPVRPLFSPPSMRATARSTGFVRNGIDAPHALHSYQCVVAQHGGAFLPRSYPEPVASRSVAQSPRTLLGYRELHRPSLPESQTLHLDGTRLRYLGKGQAR